MSLLIALGGPTGAGKTTLAYGLKRQVPWLAEALIVEGDQVRRQMLGYDLRYKMTDEDYTQEVTERVSSKLAEMIREALTQGRNVIDASGFWSAESRERIESLARSCRADFIGFWLDVPHDVLEARIIQRLAEREDSHELSVEKGHASDACLGVLSKYALLTAQKPEKGWILVPASGNPEVVLSCLVRELKNACEYTS